MKSTGSYDALPLISFGVPEGGDEAVRFLENVTRERIIPGQRPAEVGEHYFGFNGGQPDQPAVREPARHRHGDVESLGIDLPICWRSRFWTPAGHRHPSRRGRRDGVQRVPAVPPPCEATGPTAPPPCKTPTKPAPHWARTRPRSSWCIPSTSTPVSWSSSSSTTTKLCNGYDGATRGCVH